MREVFKHETSSSKWITLDTVPNKWNDSIKIPTQRDTQIQHKLQYMQSKKRRVEPHEVDEEEFIPSTDQDCSDLESSDVSVRRSRVKYSQDEEELITKHFEKFIFNEQTLSWKVERAEKEIWSAARFGKN